MNSSDFNSRKAALARYFCSDYKWKSNNDEWQYSYYKGKRNIKELEFMINVLFDYEFIHIKTIDFYNNDRELIGGTIVGSVDVCADFNGMNQGSGRADVYIAFTLTQYAFFYNQSQTLEYLLKQFKE